MSVRMPVNPELISWALGQADTDVDSLQQGELVENWLGGSSQPTLKQLQDFAKNVHVPLWLPDAEHAPRFLKNRYQIFVGEWTTLGVTLKSSLVRVTRSNVSKAGSVILQSIED